MKKNIIKISILALGLATFSCSKKSDDPTLTPAQILTSHAWKLSSTTIMGVNSPLDECEKDNFVTFSNTGVATMDEGVTKCDSEDPQTDVTTYSLSSDAKTLTLDGDVFTVVTLNDGIISLTASSNGFSFGMVFVKK